MRRRSAGESTNAELENAERLRCPGHSGLTRAPEVSEERETWKDVRTDNGRGVSTIKKDINPKMAEALKIQHEVNKKQSSLL